MRRRPLVLLLPALLAGGPATAGAAEALLDGPAAVEVAPPPAEPPPGGMLLGFEVEARRIDEGDAFELAVCASAPCGAPGAVPVQRLGFFPMLVEGERAELAVDVPADLVGQPLYFELAPVEPGGRVASSVLLRDFAWKP
jgi:hypothetical protein